MDAYPIVKDRIDNDSPASLTSENDDCETALAVSSGPLTLGFCGLGLIGGSIARAAREKHPGVRIVAWDPDSTSLSEACQDGVVDTTGNGPGPLFTDCDVVFLCAPVEYNAENLKKIAPFLKPGAILTDVGSVKGDIHSHVREYGLSYRFIGGHPMTGSERVGYRNSRAQLLENAYYILAPEQELPAEHALWMEDFVRSLGAIPLVLDCRRHDMATAAVSHVPHVLSAALVRLVRDSDDQEGLLRTLAAGGFKDITRITASSPVMWEQICMTNTDNIRELLHRCMDSLTEFDKLLDRQDSEAIRNWFDEARQYRESFPDLSSGPIRRTYVVHADIPDRPGVIAGIVQVLAAEGINIKNIGITHNREYQEGVLRMEFNTRAAYDKARTLLTENGYTLH